MYVFLIVVMILYVTKIEQIINYMGSLHNQLKITYLGRKCNQRINHLVYILVNYIKPDYILNIGRIRQNGANG